MNRRTPVLVIWALALWLLCSVWSAGAAFAAEPRGLAAPASLLPAELKGVAVQDRFLPAGTKEAGVLQTVMGPVVVARGNLSQAYWAATGDRLFEQDVIFTLREGKGRIKLANDDVVTLADNTRLALREIAGTRKTSEKKSVLALARGKAMFYAIRLFNHKSADMTVESPTAVTGVRGTKFGVEVSLLNDGARASRPILLADNSADWARHLILAQAAPQPQVATVVHGFEGTVVVTSTADGRTQTVGAGQTISTTPQGIGQLMPTPPQVAQSFQAATNVPPPAANGQGGTSSGGTGTSGGGQQSQPQGQSSSDGSAPPATTTAATTTPPVVDTSSITQQQSTSQTEQAQADPVTDPKTNASGNHVGYFAGILTNLGTQGPQDVYVSQNRYDGDDNVWGRGLKNAEDYLRVYGGGGEGNFGNPTLKWAKVFEKSSGALEKAVSHQTLGSFSDGYGQYMEWGWATIPSFTVDGQTYAVDNRAYWIFGKTPEAGLSLSGSYNGNVNGTYWTSGGGVNMTGSFSCMVNLSGGSGAVNNFNLSASGTNVSVGINGASGNIGSDAQFRLSGGTWDLKGTPANEKGASGSLYGATATGIGGVWGMSNSSGSAAGVFHGTGPGAGE